MKPYAIDRPELLRRTRAACRLLDCQVEIILVDDGSRDRSAEILQRVASEPDSPVVAVLLNRNYGQHSAILAGFEQARGDLIITLDADLQNPPEEIPRLVLRTLPSRLINRAVQRSTGVAMRDYGCMLRAYRRQVVQSMLACHERSTFIPILANSFARHTTEIEVAHAEREHGDSKYGFLKLINLMFDLLTCMTTTPLRMLSLFGGGLAVFGFLFAALLLVLRVTHGAEWAADGVFSLFAVLFIFTGAQFVGLGLLGEYLGRVYHDVRARPRFHVEQVIRAATLSPSPAPLRQVQ
jgi:undecaprenyl-phosphate 4-deoxy-4-formamido-L-arabinose transferase